MVFFDIFISPTSTKRTKFSSHFFGAGKSYPESIPKNVIFVANPTSFKRSMPLLPCISNADLLKLEKLGQHCHPVPPFPYEDDNDAEEEQADESSAGVNDGESAGTIFPGEV